MATSGARKVLIAMDESDESVFALNYYKQHIFKPGDGVTVVYAAERDERPTRQFLTERSANLTRKACEEEEQDDVVKKLENLVATAGLTGKVLAFSGDKPAAGETIIAAAKKKGVDLIVTGTRSLGQQRETKMGSVSQFIVNHAPVTVVVCREKQAS